MEPKEKLLALKTGMVKYPESWTAQTVEVQEVDDLLAEIDDKNSQVDAAKQQVSLSITGARSTSNKAKKLSDKIENIAIGLCAGSEEKLIEYGIKSKKTPEPKPVPSKTLIPVIEDDTDGEGFIVSTQTDTDADYYEWQKGIAADPTNVSTLPEMRVFKTTKKTKFVDDDTAKGVRVFYRVRAANTNGAGPWSEAVSAVQ
jgi:hypothetical protein